MPILDQTLLAIPYTGHTLTFNIALRNASSTTLTFGRLSIGFFTGADGEFCVLDEAEENGRHQISIGYVTTTAAIGAAQVSAFLRVTLLVCARRSLSHCFLHHSVRAVRVVRRGRDCHLHGQVLVPPEGA